MNAPAGLTTVPLSRLRIGDTATLHTAELPRDDAQLLHAMGLTHNAPLRVCRNGQPCIVQLSDHCNAGCRIALARELAQRLHVTRHSI